MKISEENLYYCTECKSSAPTLFGFLKVFNSCVTDESFKDETRVWRTAFNHGV